MIGLEPLYDLLEMALWSAYVKARRPLSVMILAPHSHAKSEVLMQHSNDSDGIVVINSGTRYGYYTVMNHHGYKLKHIIVPDLSSVLNDHPQVAPVLIEFLAQMTEEGITGIQTYHFRQSFSPPLKVGLLTSVTATEYYKKQKRVRQHSFRSRFVPFSYRMGEEMIEEVAEYQRRGGFEDEEKKIFAFPKNPRIKISVHCDPEHVKLLEHIIEKPFRVRGIEQLRTMLQSSALSRDREAVDHNDVKRVLDIAPYMNLDMPLLGRPHDPIPKREKRPVGRPRKQ